MSNVTPSDRWHWAALRETIAKNGVRNSLLVAPMPTASTSQILGNNECFEPDTCNIYSRRDLSGEFVVVNKHLLNDLTEMGLWSPALKNKIIYENGSVLKIPEIPDDLKAIYRTVWEIKQRIMVDMAADRGCYIDQSQSLNIHMDQPNFGKLTSLHFYAWSKGLKTRMYYLRSRAPADAIKFIVDTSMLKEIDLRGCLSPPIITIIFAWTMRASHLQFQATTPSTHLFGFVDLGISTEGIEYIYLWESGGVASGSLAQW